jgi:hypothetical protein
MPAGQDKGTLVYALFDPTTPMVPVLQRLRNVGVPEDAIEVVSPIPCPESLIGKPVVVPLVLITVLAGLVGIAVGVFFAGGTASLYPIMTGGKPVVAPPVVGIISYETMMLLAIVTTFGAMLIKILVTAPSRLSHDPRIDEGAVGVAVQLEADDSREAVVSGLLQEAGATTIERR